MPSLNARVIVTLETGKEYEDIGFYLPSTSVKMGEHINFMPLMERHTLHRHLPGKNFWNM